jgi:hypothetical protein
MLFSRDSPRTMSVAVRAYREQRTLLLALMRGVFPGGKAQIGRRLRKALEFRHRECREQRNCPDVVNCQHGSDKCRKREQTTNQRLHTYPGPAKKACAY